MRILLVQTGFLGDVVLSTPVISNLKELFPQAELDVMTTPSAGPLVEHNPHVSNLICFDKRGKDRGLGGFISMLCRLRSAKYDCVFSLHKSMRTALLLRLAGISERYGFREAAGWFLYSKTSKRADLRHEVLRNLAILRCLGKSPAELKQDLLVSWRPEHEKEAELLLREVSHKSVVAIAPGSVWLTKTWPAEGYAALARRLVANGFSVVLIGSEQDSGVARQVQEQSGEDLLNLAGKTDILVSSAIISKTKLLITNDSACLHIASACKTPVVAVFCATTPEMGFGPWNVRSECVGVQRLYCRPCGRHGGNTCPTGTHACRHNVSSQMVFEAVERVFHAGESQAKSGRAIRKVPGFKESRLGDLYALINEDLFEELDGGRLMFRSLEIGERQSMKQEAISHALRVSRGDVRRMTLDSGTSCIIRDCLRGGVLRHFIRESYFRLPCASISELRPISELSILAMLYSNGVSVPRPIAAAVRLGLHGFVYRGALATEEVEGAKNLLELAVSAQKGEGDLKRVSIASYLAGREAKKMLGLGVVHADLHLGNVLVREDNSVVLIDFDKAGRIRSVGGVIVGCVRVFDRWQRSAKKHGVEAIVLEPFSRGLEGEKED